MNLKEFKVEMVRNDYTPKKLAEALEISSSAVSKKLSGVNDFTRKDIAKAIEIFNLTPERTKEIFFAS